MVIHEIRKKQDKTLLVGLILVALLLCSCSQSATACYQQPRADLSEALAYADDDQLAFQFPLEALGLDADPPPAQFCSRGGLETFKYHAAEDYHLPAGTPVYAFADGEVSFSGPMGGYGWLAIIDHPQHGIYSLYGHLSPSRWHIESGQVEKGQLIGYLGDPDENGGSAKNPLVTHLHFGVRVGQRRDYPGWGEWRWMAGWIKPCPSDLGWLKPSAVIASQQIPQGAAASPSGLVEKWGSELGLGSVYLLSGAAIWIGALKRKKPALLLFYGILMAAASWYFYTKATRLQVALIAMAAVSALTGVVQLVKGRKPA